MSLTPILLFDSKFHITTESVLFIGSNDVLVSSSPGNDVVASFMLNKSASFLSDYKFQLERDIFDEIPFASTKVLPKALNLI